MSGEIRTEIDQILLQLPKDRLRYVLDYLRQLKNSTDKELETARLLDKIFEEDAEVLKKLAQ